MPVLISKMLDLYEENKKRMVIKLGLYSLFTVALTIFAWGLITWGGGLQESGGSFLLYGVLLLFMLLGFIVISVLHAFGYLKYVVIFIHETDKTIFRNFKIISNPVYLIVTSFIVMGALSFFSSLLLQRGLPETANFIFPLTTGSLLQSSIPIANQIFFAIFASPAENLWLFSIIAIVFAFFYYLTKGILRLFNRELKDQTARSLYPLYGFISCAVSGYVWVQLHNLVTKSAGELLPRFIFGFVNSALYVGTRSVIPSEVYHIFNNAFNQSINLLGKTETLYIFSGLIFIIVIILILSIALRKKKGERLE